MELKDIVRLADEHLKIGKESAKSAYTFKRTHNDEIQKYDKCVFDFRIEQEQFESCHVTLVVIDNERPEITGNTSIFLIEKNEFKSLRFWKREIWGGKSAFRKITLSEFPNIQQVNRIVMHGYTQGPWFTQLETGGRDKAGIVNRYVKFVIRVAEECREENVPILLESIGKVAIRNRVERSELSDTDLSPEERASIGVTRPESLATDKMAALLNIKEISNVFNERTFGKVFSSLPE